MAEKAQATLISKALSFQRLGFYIDGWADLAENMGEKAEAVRDLILESLKKRKMPDVDIAAVAATAGITSGNRNYTITTTYPGVTTLIRSGQYGNDLMVTWSTYIRPVPNWRVIAVLTVIAAFFGLQAGGAAMDAVRGFSSGFLEGLVTTGQMFFAGIFAFLFTTFGALVLEIAALSFLGFFVLRDPFWVLIVQPNIFDADDIVAMSLAAHKSILRALDTVGVDIALLRVKTEYKRKRNEGV